MDSDKRKDAVDEGTGSTTGSGRLTPSLSSLTMTTVDTGEDLLVERTLGRSLTHLSLGSAERETAILKSADILYQEGLFEESKKVLRRLLRENPSQVRARLKLKEILDREIESILSSHADEQISPCDVDESGDTLSALEKEFGISLGEDSFLEQKQAIEEFRRSVQRQISRLNSKEAMDMGIGFLEMGIGSIAGDLFKKVHRESFLGEKLNRSDYMSSTYLLAQSYLIQNLPLEAIGVLEKLLSNPEFDAAEKCEGAYLMGVANEDISQWLEALGWYEVAQTIDSGHRDVEHKTRTIRLKIIKERRQ